MSITIVAVITVPEIESTSAVHQFTSLTPDGAVVIFFKKEYIRVIFQQKL